MLPLALTLLATLAGEPNFPTRVFRVGGETHAIEIVDLDRDGAQDLLAVQNYELSWLEGDGAGEFVDRGVVPGSSGWWSFDLADADGDGWVDALGWRLADSQLIFVPGDGTGGFAAPQALGACDRRLARFTDLDGDGDLDGVAWDTTTRTLRTYLRTSAGYVPGPVTAIPGLFLNTLVLGDFDHDHHADVALSGRLGSPPKHSFSVLHGDGSGAFGQRSSLPPEFTPELEAADLDGDGFEELVLRRGSDVLAFHHLGARRYASVRLKAKSVGPLSVADADADGDIDIAAPGFPGQCLYLNDGSGRLHEQVPVRTHRNWEEATLGDLDGDGHADLASPCGAEHVCVTLLDPAAPPHASVGRTKDTFAAAASDLDGDGQIDLLLQRPGFLEFARGDGHGQFATAVQSDIAPFERIYDIALADIDSDGDLDAFGQGPSIRVLATLNDGTGRFGRPLALPFASGNLPVWGDFDGDGRNDALVARSSYAIPGELHVYRGIPGGEFAEAVVTSFPFATVPIVGDFDEDGRAETVIWGNGALMLFAWGAPGALEPVRSIPCTPFPWWTAVDDFDADGHLDLQWMSSNGGSHCALGDGTGNFTPSVSSPVPHGANFTWDRFRILHVDGDPYPDLLVGSMEGMFLTYAVCAGLGDGRFASPIDILPAFGQGLLTDLNGDDRADAVLDSRGFARPVVVLQD